MKQTNWILTLSALFMFPILRCKIADAGIHRHDVSSEKFISLAKESQFACVGQLKRDDKAIGSAVMISSQWAITSAHIFGDLPEKGVTVEIGGQTFQINEVVIHPNYKNANLKLATDLALIMLDKNYKGKTAKIYEKDKEIGATVTIVGYGKFRGAFDASANSEGKRAGQNVIDTIGGEKLPANFLGVDLTNPKNPTTDKFGNKTPLELEYIIDSGDSGGGMFMREKSKWFLAWINTRTVYDRDKLVKFSEYGFYDSHSYFTRVSTVHNWIVANINKK